MKILIFISIMFQPFLLINKKIIKLIFLNAKKKGEKRIK